MQISEDLLSKIIDKSSEDELTSYFSSIKHPRTKLEKCINIVKTVQGDSIVSFINSKSANWHQHIYLLPKTNTTNITGLYSDKFDYLGTNTTDNIVSENWLFKNVAKVLLKDTYNVLEVEFPNIINIWSYKGYYIIQISTYDTLLEKWTISEVEKVLSKTDEDAILKHCIDLLNSKGDQVKNDIVPFNNAAKGMFIADKFKIDRGVATNSEGGQLDIKVPQKFYYSTVKDMDENNYAKILLNTFNLKDNSHKNLYTYWDFEKKEYRITLKPKSGMMVITTNMNFIYKINIIKQLIDSL